MATEERDVYGRRGCSILSRRPQGGSLSTIKQHMFGQEVVRPHAIGICLCSSGGEGVCSARLVSSCSKLGSTWRMCAGLKTASKSNKTPSLPPPRFLLSRTPDHHVHQHQPHAGQ